VSLSFPFPEPPVPGAGEERPGTAIGPYKLLEQIGEGGFGVVFLAEQQQPVRRRVALKVLKPGMDSRRVVARFEAERQALALMDHPHIARVFDGGTTASGRPYFVMELVKGIPITDYCDQSQLTVKERLELFVSVCQAVQHAHTKGIIHRDLKPSNILVMLHDATPVAKVIDFGVAKALGQQLTDKTLYTGFAQMVGTPLYMSPEQAALSGLDVDTRSDIYSLGVLLYELLTGTTPFDKKRFQEAGYDEIRRIIREEEPPKPSTRISTLGETGTAVSAQRRSDPKRLSQFFRGELDWIVMKAVEKDPNRRFETAGALAADLQRYLRDEPVLACPPSRSYRLRKLLRKHRAAAVTAAAFVGLLLTGAAVSTWQAVRAWQAQGDAEARRGQAEEAKWKARLREAEALVGQAHGTRLSGRSGRRFEALEALGKAAAIGRELGQPPEWFDRPRNEAIAALALPDIHLTREWDVSPPGTVSVDLSDDFELYVRTNDRGAGTIRRVADDTEVAHLPEMGERAAAGFGCGRILLVRGESSHVLRLWDLGDANPVLRLEERQPPGWGWSFRADGRLVALCYADGAIRVYDVAEGTRIHDLKPERIVRGLAASLHPSAPFVAVSSYFFRELQVRDLRTGAVVAAVSPFPGGICRAAWSPDGRTLTVPVADSPTIQQFAFDPGAPALRLIRTIPSPQDASAGYIVSNAAGDRLAGTSAWQSGVYLLDAVSGRVLFSAPSLSPWSLPRFDRTGQRLGAVAADSKAIGLASVADGREYRTLLHLPQAARAQMHDRPAVHPGGRLAAIGLSDGLSLFDLGTDRELAHIPAPRGDNPPASIRNVAFDGQGNMLTNGFEGFFRWPVRADGHNAGRPIVGPPERLPFHPGNHSISTSRDGRVLAQSMWAGYGMAEFAGGWILHPNAAEPRRVDAGRSMASNSVSPDGRWVAFGPYGERVKVYDAATAQLAWQGAARDLTFVRFSPDGRWLVTNGDGGRLYTAGTWQPGPQLGPGTPWDATSELAVLGQSNGIYRLVELATGRELARLEDPEQNTGRATFTPDRTQLVVAAKDGLRVWDLRRLREQLAKLDLDWDAPPYPAAIPPSQGADQQGAAQPLEVQLDLGELRDKEKGIEKQGSGDTSNGQPR
jgi:serine/threonine protein kinase/WD40 repeat protein